MIVRLFEDLSRQIWDNIHLSNLYGTNYGEETISDMLLLEIVKKQNYNIRIVQTPKHLEALKGTDWEWIVGSNKYGWLRYAIQAKKLNINRNYYASLNHHVGTKKRKKYQIDLLKKYASTNSAIPIYNFYNYHPAAIESDHWHCPLPYDMKLLGWTFTFLSNIETVIAKRGDRTFEGIHSFKETLPIRCLFSCKEFKDIYFDRSLIGKSGNLFGQTIKKIPSLPDQFLTARDLVTIDSYPEELYNPTIKIYPKRIAIIDLAESLIQ